MLLCAWASRGLASDFYVAGSGDDANAGTAKAPFATISAARDAIRNLKESKGLPPEGITVWLAAGIYNQAATLSFDERDSGTATSPISYRAGAGQEVRVAGSTSLDPAWFTLVDSSSPVWARLAAGARGKVYSVNLRDHGISDFGSLKPGGFHLYHSAPLELFFNGRPMTLAQWPNRDQAMERTELAASNSRFTYANPRPARWQAAPEIWLHGLWNNFWADFHVQVSSINTATQTINLVDPPNQFGLGSNQPYYAYNILEELDQPEEYYLDRESGILYFWPPAPLMGAVVQASMLENPLVELSNASFIKFEGIIFEASRGPLLVIEDGEANLVQDCLLRNCGEFGAKVTGSKNGIDRSEIVACGEDGVQLGGGVRSTLAAGNNFVTNSRIRRTGRIDWSYHPAVVLALGCGNIVAHNLIEDLPHAAIMFSGNNHRIEFNEIRNVCQLTEDVGAIYAGRDWSYRGNVIKSNFVHHVYSIMEGPGPNGIYLDDGMSGVQVAQNIFYKIQGAATYYGGGRDNITVNNVMAYTQIAHCNGDYDRMFINNVRGSPWNFLERLAADGIQYQAEPWLSAYPACAVIPNSWPEIQKGTWRNPEHSVFARNVGWSNQVWTYETNFSHTGVFAVYDSMAGNDPAIKPLLDERACWERTSRPQVLSAPVADFLPLEFASIGPAAYAGTGAQPQTPTFLAVNLKGPTATFHWGDDGDLPWNRPQGWRLYLRNIPGSAWRLIGDFGADCTSAQIDNLSPATAYSVRVDAWNSMGIAESEAWSLTMPPKPPRFTPGDRIEVESPLTVVHNAGKAGSITPVAGPGVSGKCVSLFDVDDAVSVDFSVPTAGVYRIGARVRSGAANMPIGSEYWPNGYEFKLDGVTIRLVGDSTTISPRTQLFGPTYWGTMYSEGIPLASGPHVLEVVSKAKWAAVDYVEADALMAPP